MRKKSSSVSAGGFLGDLADNSNLRIKSNEFDSFLSRPKKPGERVRIFQSNLDESLWINPQKISSKFCRFRANIVPPQEFPFAKNCRVERMGKHGWRGTITAIEGKSAFVNWGFCRTWISITELYPLDSRDKPYLPSKKPNLIEIARRARKNLDFSSSKVSSDNIQGTIFSLD